MSGRLSCLMSGETMLEFGQCIRNRFLASTSMSPASECSAPLQRGTRLVEKHYQRQKRWAEIENFSGRSLLTIRQDIHVKILAMNLAAMVRNVAKLIADR